MLTMRKRIFIITLAVMMIVSSVTFGHSGRTDSSGGHRDNQNSSGLGSYHYHHGYGPHLHTGGVCPYSSAPTSYSYGSGSESYYSRYSKETIKSMQNKLNELGYSCGVADGIVGSKTIAAVKKFQSDNGLTVDGLAGDSTLKTLYDSTVKDSSNSISKFSTREGIKAIQERLNELGYDCGVADGIIGAKTISAIKRFQSDNGLTVDGIAGFVTINALGL